MSRKSQIKSAVKGMLKLYNRVDTIMEAARVQFDAPCKKGCWHCCYQIASISIAEGIIMAEAVGNLSFVIRQLLIKRSLAHANKLYNPLVTTSSWFEDKIPCVFLSDGECRIYDARPLTCRTMMVAKGSDCSIEFGPGKLVKMINNREILLAGLQEAKKASGILNIPIGYAPMPVAFLWGDTVYHKGVNVLKGQIHGTIFSNDYESLLFWKKLEEVPKKGSKNNQDDSKIIRPVSFFKR